MRYYFRKAGFPRVSLPGEPGSVGFAKAYAEAKDAAKPQGVSLTEGPRSVGALIGRYYKTLDFGNLSDVSKRSYRQVLERFRAKHGRKVASRLERKHLIAIFNAMAETPAAAKVLRKRLLPVFELGVDLEWFALNPVKQTKAIKHKSDGFPPWDEGDIERFEKGHKSGTRERLAMALLLYTGQRRSDVVKMGRQHVKDDRISVVQQKTGKRLWIPLHPALAAELAHVRRDGLAVLQTQYGEPFTPAGFTNWFVAKARAVGVEDRTPHGLRKAAGRRLAEAGCTAHEIASILGHDSLTEAEKYCRSASQGTLADQAMVKLVGTDAEQKRQTRLSNQV
jgi:integrase